MADPSTERLPKTFRGGGYEVTVNSDRSIQVRSGDWLSKYSAAIYGNFDHVGEFYRKSGGQWIDIVNKDAITAGETLYWLPKGKPAGGAPGINPPVGGGGRWWYRSWGVSSVKKAGESQMVASAAPRARYPARTDCASVLSSRQSGARTLSQASSPVCSASMVL